MRSKFIDYVDFLIIAILIALCIYVGWAAFASRPLVHTKATAFERVIAHGGADRIEI